MDKLTKMMARARAHTHETGLGYELATNQHHTESIVRQIHRLISLHSLFIIHKTIVLCVAVHFVFTKNQ